MALTSSLPLNRASTSRTTSCRSIQLSTGALGIGVEPTLFVPSSLMLIPRNG